MKSTNLVVIGQLLAPVNPPGREDDDVGVRDVDGLGDAVGVAAVVEEGHGGEDRPAHWNDVELGYVVVLEDALRDLQPVGADHLQVLQQEAGHEHLATQVVAARAGAQTPEEAIELETLAHEDGLGRLLEQVLE